MTEYEKKIREIFERYADMDDEGFMMMPFKIHEIESFVSEVADMVENESDAAWQRGIDQCRDTH